MLSMVVTLFCSSHLHRRSTGFRLASVSLRQEAFRLPPFYLREGGVVARALKNGLDSSLDQMDHARLCAGKLPRSHHLLGDGGLPFE